VSPAPQPERPLLLVRHGRTAANASGLLLGRHDPSLDGRGRAEAAALARTIASGRFGPIAAVVSSPLRRTCETAATIRRALDAAPVGAATGSQGRRDEIDERLIELDYGEMEGVPLAEVEPETWRRWRADVDFAPAGGESLRQLGKRVRAACVDWSASTPLAATGAAGSAGESAPSGTVVLVSHVSPIKAAVAWALGVGDEVAWRTHLDTASISRIVQRQGAPALTSFNDTGHLLGE
jgi:broad specificity phosphatase PhoE